MGYTTTYVHQLTRNEKDIIDPKIIQYLTMYVFGIMYQGR